MIPAEFLEAINDPKMLHAISVHLPIAFAIAGVPLAFLSVIFHRSHALRWTAIGCYLALAGTAYAAVYTGEGAQAQVPNTAPQDIWDAVNIHEQYATNAWIVGLVTAGLLLVTAIPVRVIQVGMGLLGFLSSLVAAGWIAVVGHYGGMLVYKHGVGTPAMAQYTEGALAPEEAPPATDVTPAPDTEPAVPEDPAMTLPPEPDDTGLDPVDDGYFPPLRPLDQAAARAVSYREHIAPIMEAYCVECHNEDKDQGALIMTTHAGILAGGEKMGASVVPGQPDESPMVQYIRGILRPQMPKGDLPIPEEDLHTIRLWILAGAPDDSGEPGGGTDVAAHLD